jgi:hypothetical protein
MTTKQVFSKVALLLIVCTYLHQHSQKRGDTAKPPSRLVERGRKSVGGASVSTNASVALEYTLLDQSCFHDMPSDGLCLNPYNVTSGCVLFFRRFSQLACAGFEASRGLCPCGLKRTSEVRNVRITAIFSGNLVSSILAFAFDTVLRSWSLIDSSSSEFNSLSCMYGHRVLRKKLTDVYTAFRSLSGSYEGARLTISKALSPWACSSNIRFANHSDVFYALDSSLNSPGHAVDSIFFAIGLYFRDDLHTRGVPWIVPCSDQWTSTTAWTWTKFFVEINQVLQLPVFPLDIRWINATDLHTFPFPVVHFAPYYLGWNQGCVRHVTSQLLWPYAEKGASSLGSPKAISFMKVLFPNSTSMYSPKRAFLFSLRYYKMLEVNHVVTLGANVPLIERMFLVNKAELIVTTWGSALAIATTLMIAQGNRSHRLLVLIHPGYCLEASRLLRSRKKTCSTVTARGPSRVVHRKMMVRDGALTDFVGGNGFCAKFLVVAALKFVRQSDIEFRCP